MSVALLVAASILFASGGLFMKLSDGLSRGIPTLTFLALFAAGACLQAVGMKRADMGVSYIFVLGAEAIVTLILSTLALHEHYTASRLAAIAMIVAGIAWLRLA